MGEFRESIFRRAMDSESLAMEDWDDCLPQLTRNESAVDSKVNAGDRLDVKLMSKVFISSLQNAGQRMNDKPELI
jgi:hypothetical protein